MNSENLTESFSFSILQLASTAFSVTSVLYDLLVLNRFLYDFFLDSISFLIVDLYTFDTNLICLMVFWDVDNLLLYLQLIYLLDLLCTLSNLKVLILSLLIDLDLNRDHIFLVEPF